MRVWLDDVRPMPEGFTFHARSAAEAIAVLKTGNVEFISLDHDLAPEHYGDGWYPQQTGYTVALWIENAVVSGRIKCPEWACHSMNPSGKARIESAMQSAANHERG